MNDEVEVDICTNGIYCIAQRMMMVERTTTLEIEAICSEKRERRTRNDEQVTGRTHNRHEPPRIIGVPDKRHKSQQQERSVQGWKAKQAS